MISLRLINVVVFDHGEWMRYGYIIIICNRGCVINLLWVTTQFDHVRIVAGHSPELELCYLLNIFCDFLERVFFLYVKTRLKDVNCWFDLIWFLLAYESHLSNACFGWKTIKNAIGRRFLLRQLYYIWTIWLKDFITSDSIFWKFASEK